MSEPSSFRRSVEMRDFIRDMERLYDSKSWDDEGYDKQARILIKFAIKRIKADKISYGSLIEYIGE